MKKSEMYYAAMICVVNNHTLSAADKLEIVERLTMDKQLAEWSERSDEEKKAEEDDF